MGSGREIETLNEEDIESDGAADTEEYSQSTLNVLDNGNEDYRFSTGI